MLNNQTKFLVKAAAASSVALCISLFFWSCTVLSNLAPVKEDTSHVRDWIVVPVFYATTRQRAATEAIDFLEKKAESGLRFGVKNIVIPAPESTSVSEETRKRMGWQLIHVQTPLPQGKIPDLPAATHCAIPDREIATGDAAFCFDKYRAGSGSQDVIFFVHGCCATFHTSIERSARIAVSMQIPLVVYDWASPRGFSKYLENETLVEQTNDDFFDFLNAVEAVVPASHTILIGHSMGARFLDTALLRRAERTRFGIHAPLYKEVVFSQPDIDARAYIRHNLLIASQAEKTRIYFNANDGRLTASATAHGGFARLGRPGVLLDRLCQIENQDLLNITQCEKGHEIPFAVLACMSRGESTQKAGFALKPVGSHLFVLEKSAAI